MNIETIKLIVFLILLLDAMIANLIAWLHRQWWSENLGFLAHHFPMTKGWAGLYLMLVIWIGFLTLN